MTYWIVQADYRPLNEKSPHYSFVSESGRTESQVRKEFLRRYSDLKNIMVRQLTEQEMENEPIRKWLMWL